jgi:hypothetical protein
VNKQKSARPPKPQEHPPVDTGLVRPRHAAPDAFEQNPLREVSERISLQATEGLDDAGRVREALRIVIAEGLSVSEAARRCHVAPSFLSQWREKYLAILNETPSIAEQPLMDKGAMLRDADLVRIPRVAREHFAENWERLVEATRATPSTFRQHPVLVFLENSWLTSWLYQEGRLDRGVLAGVSVVVAVLVLTATFIFAGHFYRQEKPQPDAVEDFDVAIRKAADVARNFFRAEPAEEKMKFVRADGPVRALMEEYFRRHPAVGFPVADLTKAIPDTDRFALEFDIPSLDRRHFCVVINRAGTLLVDWETTSLFQEANLEQIRQSQPRSPVRVAVHVVSDDYYNYSFTRDRFRCYRLYYPGLQLDLLAYAAKDSAEERTLNTLLQPVTSSRRQVTAVLEVKYPPGDVPANQVELVRIVSEDWILP